MSPSLVPQDCCGLWMLNGISHSRTPQDVLKAIQPSLMHTDVSYREKPFVMFSGVVERKKADQYSGRMDDYGQALADFIVEHNLGVVTASPTRANGTPNTRGGNILRIWTWAPNYDNLRIYYNRKDKEARATSPSSLT